MQITCVKSPAATTSAEASRAFNGADKIQIETICEMQCCHNRDQQQAKCEISLCLAETYGYRALIAVAYSKLLQLETLFRGSL